MITVKINGKKLEFEKPDTILKICRNIGIEIPTLCNDHRLVPHGACRLCVVEVVGARNYPASCSTMIAEGMEIHTHSEKIVEARRAILNLILANHTEDCLTCEKAGDCKLQNYCYEYNVKRTTYTGAVRRVKTDDTNKFYDVDPEKCILCGKCERVCSELQCSDAISFRDRGFLSCVTRFSDFTDDCVSCGNCVSICPVGALSSKKKVPFRTWEVKSVKTTCVYCGVGCQLKLNIKDNKIVRVDPVFELPNDGLLCVKGKFGYNFVNHPDRLTKPLIKKNEKFEEATWEEAYKLITDKMKEVKDKNGADALAGLSSARCTNEENYLFQKLFRGVVGTNNVDHCARLCHASTVAGLATTLGSGAMTNSIEEVLNSDLIFITGSNTTETHPVIGSKIKQAVLRGAKLIVAEPRKIDLANDADVFLQIRPGTNVALYNGMMNVILEEGLQDKEYIAQKTEAFEDLERAMKHYTPEKVAKICGIDAEDLRKAARLYAKADKAGIYYSMGVTQHSTGTEGVMSVSNLALLCGNIGKESAGVNPLRGQNNVQGACDMGALPNVFSGYQKVVDDSSIDKFKKAW
ncbi:molybdopterin-dependent oxidoreductase, partial [bacterium]|nr:molybdopterin-dependent oxidoreductase [bacterium]